MDEIILKNNEKTFDPRLGRIKQFDPRSRKFNIAEVLPPTRPPRSYRWRCLLWLDQLATSACVGFSFSHELAARPKEVQGIDYDYAQGIYNQAQEVDEWAGSDYEGTSVLAGAKIVKDLGKIKEYRWGFNIIDIRDTVAYFGPVVFGVNWYSSMFIVGADGFIRITHDATLSGGHAILCRGYSVKMDAYLLKNSWGIGWGISGDCWITSEDLQRLLLEQGECCVPIGRTL